MEFIVNLQSHTKPAAAALAAIDIVTRLPRDADSDLTYQVCENLTPQTEGCFQLTRPQPLDPKRVIGEVAWLSERTMKSIVILRLKGEIVCEIKIDPTKEA